MIKILFVCHGNICRSPMAEFIMKNLVAKHNLSDEFYIESCATSTEEIWNGIGNPIYPPARAELERNNIPFDKNKRARLITKSDYDKFDLLICMDSRNLRNIKGYIPNDPENKIKKLMEFAGSSADVADPWFYGNFDVTFEDITRGCNALLDSLISY